MDISFQHGLKWTMDNGHSFQHGLKWTMDISFQHCLKWTMYNGHSFPTWFNIDNGQWKFLSNMV